MALITDIQSGIGPSITNCIEHVRRDLLNAGHVTETTTILEHYEDDGTFSICEFSIENRPGWTFIEKTEAAQICGCEPEKFDLTVADLEDLQKILYRERLRIHPQFFELDQDEISVVERRRNILMNRISKTDLESLVNRGASEKELQSLLRKDLSILGDVYAHPAEEYICFSEFPLFDGRVDFVVFQGRSRMKG